MCSSCRGEMKLPIGRTIIDMSYTWKHCPPFFGRVGAQHDVRNTPNEIALASPRELVLRYVVSLRIRALCVEDRLDYRPIKNGPEEDCNSFVLTLSSSRCRK